MSAASLSALSALLGSAIGAMASFATTWLTQHYQERQQRRAQELTRRERLFGEFILHASKLYADALAHDAFDPALFVPLYALKAQLALFASRPTTERAEEVLATIIETYHRPNADFRDRRLLENHTLDILRPFTEACRRELTGVVAGRGGLAGA